MPKWRPPDYKNPIETLDIYSASRANAFEAGFDYCLEVLRKMGKRKTHEDKDVETGYTVTVDDGATVVVIPDDEEV
jgi:hypothetical protein